MVCSNTLRVCADALYSFVQGQPVDSVVKDILEHWKSVVSAAQAQAHEEAPKLEGE